MTLLTTRDQTGSLSTHFWMAVENLSISLGSKRQVRGVFALFEFHWDLMLDVIKSYFAFLFIIALLFFKFCLSCLGTCRGERKGKMGYKYL